MVGVGVSNNSDQKTIREVVVGVVGRIAAVGHVLVDEKSLVFEDIRLAFCHFGDQGGKGRFVFDFAESMPGESMPKGIH